MSSGRTQNNRSISVGHASRMHNRCGARFARRVAVCSPRAPTRIWPWPRRTRAGAHVVPVLVQLPGLLHEREGQRPPARAPPPGAVLLEPPFAAPIAPLRRSRPSPPPSPNPFPCATACPAPIRSPHRHRSSSTPPGRQAPNLRNAPRPGSQSERNLALPPVAVRCTAWFDG